MLWAAVRGALDWLTHGALDVLLGKVEAGRQQWSHEYAEVHASLARQNARLDAALGRDAVPLTYQDLSLLHRQSAEQADLAHAAFASAQRVLDALGESIVETAKQRKTLERRVLDAKGFERRQLEESIEGLHRLRDQHLVPEKDRIKADKKRLLAELRRLNRQTAELKALRTAQAEIESPLVPCAVKWFDSNKGYGFLLCQQGDVYLHLGNVPDQLVLVPGMSLLCRVRVRRDGRLFVAGRVRLQA